VIQEDHGRQRACAQLRHQPQRACGAGGPTEVQLLERRQHRAQRAQGLQVGLVRVRVRVRAGFKVRVRVRTGVWVWVGVGVGVGIRGRVRFRVARSTAVKNKNISSIDAWLCCRISAAVIPD
jgi:hypothetical protein